MTNIIYFTNLITVLIDGNRVDCLPCDDEEGSIAQPWPRCFDPLTHTTAIRLQSSPLLPHSQLSLQYLQCKSKTIEKNKNGNNIFLVNTSFNLLNTMMLWKCMTYNNFKVLFKGCTLVFIIIIKSIYNQLFLVYR